MTLFMTSQDAHLRRPSVADRGSVRSVEVDGVRPGSDLVILTASALAGDRVSWETLVDRLKGAAWSAIGSVDLPLEDRKDAFAATFFRLYEKLGSVHEPERLHGWVATTARREALAIAAARRKEGTVELVDAHLAPERDATADRLLDQELRSALRAAFARLSESCQRLLGMLMNDPPPSYTEVASVLHMRIGSIGPTRQRCLARLRETPEMRSFRDGAAS